MVKAGYRVEMLWNALFGEEEEEEEEIFFYCPVRGCSYKTKSLGALKVHFRRFHADLKYYCPICKKRVKTAHHSKYFNDDKHLVLYYLTRHNTSWNNKTELVKRARDVAYKRLRSGNFKF